MISDEVFVQIRFTDGDFSDALYYTLDEYESVTPEEIEEVKKHRVNKWKSVRNNPPPIPKPTKEELALEINGLKETIANLQQVVKEKESQLSGTK